jgi:hypothetical protein
MMLRRRQPPSRYASTPTASLFSPRHFFTRQPAAALYLLCCRSDSPRAFLRCLRAAAATGTENDVQNMPAHAVGGAAKMAVSTPLPRALRGGRRAFDEVASFLSSYTELRRGYAAADSDTRPDTNHNRRRYHDTSRLKSHIFPSAVPPESPTTSVHELLQHMLLGSFLRPNRKQRHTHKYGPPLPTAYHPPMCRYMSRTAFMSYRSAPKTFTFASLHTRQPR